MVSKCASFRYEKKARDSSRTWLKRRNRKAERKGTLNGDEYVRERKGSAKALPARVDPIQEASREDQQNREEKSRLNLK